MKLRANEVILIKLDERPNASMAPWTITFSPDGAKWHRLYAETRSGGIRSAKRYLRRLRKASVIKA